MRWPWLVGGVSVLLVALIAAMVVTRSPQPVSRVEHPDLPGIDVNGLDAKQFQLLLAESKHTPCVCGCGFTLADCRHKDPSCRQSGPILDGMVREYRTSRIEVKSNE